MDDVSEDAGPRPGLLEGADPAVDWSAEIRRSRRQPLAFVLPVTGFPFGFILLTGDLFGTVRGRAAWWAAGAVALALGAAALITFLLSTSRPAQGARMVAQAALRVHADPGPAVRSEVDWSAREQRAYRWTWPYAALGAVGLLEQGQWDAPFRASAGALLVALFWAALLAEALRRSREARRWLDEPPGPIRAMPPPAAWERRRRTRLLLSGTPALITAFFVGTVLVRAVHR